MLCNKIREMRRKSGLSQEELAERLDVSRQAVSKWETGSAVPTPEKLVDISKLFGVSLDHLMCDTDELPSESAEPKESAFGRRFFPKKAVAVVLFSAAALTFVLLAVLHITGNGGSVSGSFVVTFDGTGLAVAGGVLCVIGGIAMLIPYRK